MISAVQEIFDFVVGKILAERNCCKRKFFFNAYDFQTWCISSALFDCSSQMLHLTNQVETFGVIVTCWECNNVSFFSFSSSEIWALRRWSQAVFNLVPKKTIAKTEPYSSSESEFFDSQTSALRRWKIKKKNVTVRTLLMSPERSKLRLFNYID